MPKLKHIWEEEQKEKTGSLKKPVTCKGKKEHQFVLVIPKYYKTADRMSVENINTFYDLMEREKVFMNGQNEALNRIGVYTYKFSGRVAYYYKCIVCGKEKTTYER